MIELAQRRFLTLHFGAEELFQRLLRDGRLDDALHRAGWYRPDAPMRQDFQEKLRLHSVEVTPDGYHILLTVEGDEGSRIPLYCGCRKPIEVELI